MHGPLYPAWMHLAVVRYGAPVLWFCLHLSVNVAACIRPACVSVHVCVQVVEADGNPDIPGHTVWSIRVEVLCAAAHKRSADAQATAQGSQHSALAQ